MEKARYWMWTKHNKPGLSSTSHLQASTAVDDSSWEEEAFAEDAAGPLGGCIWPPRSYSCSFCGREFRSAQALGGHMNVHRRDRARLKQSPSHDHPPHNEILQQDPDHNQQNHQYFNYLPSNTRYSSSIGFPYPSQICTLVCNPNPNLDPMIIPSPSSPSTISPPLLAQENCSERNFFPLKSPSLSPPTRLDSRNIEKERNTRIQASGYRGKMDYLKTDLSVSLNLVVRRTCPTLSDGQEEADVLGCKRSRSDHQASSLPFFLKKRTVDMHKVEAGDVRDFINSPTSIDDLDLELRLGNPPKVK